MMFPRCCMYVSSKSESGGALGASCIISSTWGRSLVDSLLTCSVAGAQVCQKPRTHCRARARGPAKWSHHPCRAASITSRLKAQGSSKRRGRGTPYRRTWHFMLTQYLVKVCRRWVGSTFSSCAPSGDATTHTHTYYYYYS